MNSKKYKINWFKFVLRILLIPVIIVWLIMRKIKAIRRSKSGGVDIYHLSQIDSLSGEEFENLLKTIFEKQEYVVELTKKSHDYGADLVLKKRNKISIVQAKCYGKNIGIKAVQEIIAAKRHYNADEMFVATNRYFSKDAIVLASEYNVKLIDRDVISGLIKRYMPQIEPSQKKYIATTAEAKNDIETRYKFWI